MSGMTNLFYIDRCYHFSLNIPGTAQTMLTHGLDGTGGNLFLQKITLGKMHRMVRAMSRFFYIDLAPGIV